MKRIVKGRVPAVLIAVAALALLWACAGSNKRAELSNLPTELVAPSADSVGASAGMSEAAVAVAKAKKESKLQGPKEQSLTVKFRQNDTEVEMVVDPNSTNLALDLIRGPNGYLEISRGDSVFYKRGQSQEEMDGKAARPGERLTSLERTEDSKPGKDNLDNGDLTDEIVRDINLAQKMFYERRYEEALEVLKASLEKKKTATAYALGGSIYYVNGEIEQAVSAWENALQINPHLEQVSELVKRLKK